MTEAPRRQLDAIELLMQDHRELESLFREFEYLNARDEDTGRVVGAACAELKAHDTLKIELFCPAVLDAADEPGVEGLLARVEAGHQAIRDILVRVEQADADPAKRDAHFTVLSETAEREFERTETEVFPLARSVQSLDLLSVAERMKARKNDMALCIQE